MIEDKDDNIDPAIPKPPESETKQATESESRTDQIDPAIPEPPASEVNEDNTPRD